ncbi:polyprenyl synthetase family protein [Streptomyces sp. NPDC026672]|uniref:polyprenyl synthetase family protein n=1 Tax=unclassified Streptomyces TaxID=2593676 RepID=UPI0033CFFA4A
MRPSSARQGTRDEHPPDPAEPGTVPRGEDVDADVPAAVERSLRQILDERVAQASSLEPLFGQDLAARLAAFTLAGGKRTRPRFLWWALRSCGGGGEPARTKAALRIAAALELIQTCALVHDDVMDDSDRRRGRPSVHADIARRHSPCCGRTDRGFGRAAAILVGDLALAWADDVVAATVTEPAAADAVAAIWRALRTEMVAGQYLDLHGQATGTRSPAAAVRVAYLKSALYSVERPIALGAALARADPRTTAALCAAGRCSGIAFQLRDDLLGAFAEPQVTGKPSGDDIRQGKPTYLVAVARDRAVAEADTDALTVLDRCVGAGRLTEAQMVEVRQVLIRTGARAAVEHRIEQLVARSLRHLTEAHLRHPGRDRLRDLLCAAAGVMSEPDVAAGPRRPGAGAEPVAAPHGPARGRPR